MVKSLGVIDVFALLKNRGGNSLAVQWLGLGSFTVEGLCWIPGRGTTDPTYCVAQPINRYINLKKNGCKGNMKQCWNENQG